MGICCCSLYFESFWANGDAPEFKGDDPEKFILIEGRTNEIAFSGMQKKALLSIENKIFIKYCLMRNDSFVDEVNHYNLSFRDIDNLVNSFQEKKFSGNEVLYHQNDHICSLLYIASQGIFKVMNEFMECEAELIRGDIINDLTFFHETPSKFSVLADVDLGRAFCLTKRDFKLITEKGRDLRNIKLLESLSDDQRLLFKKKVTIVNFVKGDFILRRGSPISAIYLILNGTVGVLGISSPIESSKPFLFRGDYFGENRFLLGGMTSLETFVAMRETSVCMIDKELYDNFEIFGSARARMISDNTYTLSKAIINTDYINDYGNWKSTHLLASEKTNDSSTDGGFEPASAEMIREDVDIFSKAIIGQMTQIL